MRLSRRPLLVGALVVSLAAPALPGLLRSSAVAEDAGTAALPARELGHDRIGVRRHDTWYLRDALDGGPARGYKEHLPGWLPVAGDTDGDGTATVGLFRDGVWLLRDAEGGLPRVVRFGLPGDRPVLGDWNGDGIDTVGVFRAGRWFLRDENLSGPTREFGYGMPGDVPVVGDWDGNGRTDIGVRRGVTWFQRDAADAGPSSRSFGFGLPGDIPVSGDWDHDGRDTVGLFRDGLWLFRRANGPSPYQTAHFGMRGDLPVVRRGPSLAPGVHHHVLRDPAGPWTVHVASVDLRAPSTPETVLAAGRVPSLEPVSSMTRRARAVIGINGDYALSSGRPVHLFANDGRLAQTPQVRGRALMLDATGRRVRMGFPDLRVSLHTTATSRGVPRVNAGAPQAEQLAAFTAEGRPLEVPPNDACYAGLTPAGGRAMTADGAVRTPLRVTGTRCGGPRPVLPPSDTVLTGNPQQSGGAFVRSLLQGQTLQLTTQLGFPGAVDALGGNPMLVSGGRIVDGDVDGSGGFFARHPRTAVGVTGSGQLLLVVVDGRQGSYSAGMTLRELARLMARLGAREAVNLDGGGSSEMVVNGLVVNRPSDGRERPVSSALVVLPGPDVGQGDLAGHSAAPGRANQPAPAGVAGTGSAAAEAAALDAGSTGGLLDALRSAGVPLPPELTQTADAFARPR